jgi:cbb3-type cytochrome oxidase subunit 3
MRKEIRNSLIYFAGLMLLMIVSIAVAAFKDAARIKP